MVIAHLLIAIGFVWIYNKGKEAKPAIGQGIRYGIAIAMIATIPTYLIYFTILPLTGDVVAKTQCSAQSKLLSLALWLPG